MIFSGLTDKMNQALRSFRNKGKLTEADVKAGMREVKLALLEADVNFKVVKDFVKAVEARAVGAEVMESLVPSQQIIKIVNEELTALMGGSCACKAAQFAGEAAAFGRMRCIPPRRGQTAAGRRGTDRCAGVRNGWLHRPPENCKRGH